MSQYKHPFHQYKHPERCRECPHQRYCPNFDPDYYAACGLENACVHCGEEHGMYWDCYNQQDVRDGDAWGGFTGRSGG